jgi:hypothetical protein
MARTPVPNPTLPPKFRIALATELMSYLNSKGEKNHVAILAPGFFDSFLEGKSPSEVAEAQLAIDQLKQSIQNVGT